MEESSEKKDKEKLLPIIMLQMVYHESTDYEIDHYDLYEVFGNFGEVENVINLGGSCFYIVFIDIKSAIMAMKTQNHFFVSDIRASMNIKVMLEDEMLSDGEKDMSDIWHSLFEIKLPEQEFFDAERRIKGIQDYNLKRVLEMSNREHFHGYLKVDFKEQEKLTIEQEGKTIPMQKIKIDVESNNKDKFNMSTRQIHELAANIYEDFKKFNDRMNIMQSHLFVIKKVDMSKVKLKISFKNN